MKARKKMKKTDKLKSYVVQAYGTKKTFFVPYAFKGYDLFAILFGIGLVLLSSYIIINETKLLNVILKLIPGIFGAFLAYSTLLSFLNYRFNRVTVFLDRGTLRVRKLWKTIDVSFDEISEFLVQVDKLEGVVDSKGIFKGADTLSCNVELVTLTARRVKLLGFPPFQPDGNESKLIEKIKKEGMSFVKEIGVSKPVSWNGIVVQ